MSKASPTFYIFHGDDDLRIDEEVAKMRAKMEESSPNASMNIDEFDGERTEAGAVLGAASSFPFLADKRLIIVKGMLAHITRKGAGATGKKAVEMLLETLPTLPDWTRLVFVERGKLDERHKILLLARQIEGSGIEKAFVAPKDSTSWILKRAQDAYQAQMEPRAAASLSEVTQGDLRLADNELVKLVAFVGPDRAITEADVAALTPYVAEARIFDMIDALAEGRGKAAMVLLYRLLEQKDQDPFKIYGSIISQFRNLLLVKEYLSAGGYPGGISEGLGMHKFVAEKLSRQSRKFTLEQLEQVYRILHEYDVKMKTGGVAPDLALDLLVARLSA